MSESSPAVAAVPYFSAAYTLSKRDKLVRSNTGLLGHVMKDEKLERLINRLHADLPSGILRMTVADSVKDVVNEELQDHKLTELAWRLAGNIEKLKRHEPVQPWNGQFEQEWLPAEIVCVTPGRVAGERKALFTFQILGGSYCPGVLSKYWSRKQSGYFATYVNAATGLGMGFGRNKTNRRGEQLGRRLYYDPRQFYGLRCFLLVDEAPGNEEPRIVELGSSGSFMSYNQKLLKGRDRLQSPCVKGMPTSQECFLCPVGRDVCHLATHEKSYQLAECSRCKRQKSFIDPADLEYEGMCTRCAQNLRDS